MGSHWNPCSLGTGDSSRCSDSTLAGSILTRICTIYDKHYAKLVGQEHAARCQDDFARYDGPTYASNTDDCCVNRGNITEIATKKEAGKSYNISGLVEQV